MASQQTFNRGIRKLIFKPWLAENSWGSELTVLGAQSANLQVVYETDEQRGDDAVLDRYSKPISVTVTVQEATIDPSLYAALMGGTLSSTSAYYDMMVGEDDLPSYVGIGARIVTTNGLGDLQWLIPKAKISNNPTFNATGDAYMSPQFELQGVHEGTINGLYRFRQFTAPTALEIPLRLTTGGF